jgi:hypothetical protein
MSETMAAECGMQVAWTGQGPSYTTPYASRQMLAGNSTPLGGLARTRWPVAAALQVAASGSRLRIWGGNSLNPRPATA